MTTQEMQARVADKWWRPNYAALSAYVRSCGFENVRRGRFHRPPSKPEMRTWYADLEARAPS